VENTLMYTPRNYGPAIYLALNHAAGGLEIHDYIYLEEYDVWVVDCNEREFHTDSMKLEGSFVRTCHEATKKGVTSWTQEKAA
jgi:hypothetical protein